MCSKRLGKPFRNFIHSKLQNMCIYNDILMHISRRDADKMTECMLQTLQKMEHLVAQTLVSLIHRSLVIT